MSEPHNCENGGCLMDEFCCHDVANLQARLAQCEGERDNYRAVLEGAEYERIDEIGKQSHELCLTLGQMAASFTKNLKAERDAALERVREVEAAKEALYSTLVDERKRLYALEAAVKEAGDAWQAQTNVREGITFRLKMKALLALRAGMA